MMFTGHLSCCVEALEFGSHPPCGVGVIIILWPKELGFWGGMGWLKGTQMGYSAGTFPRRPPHALQR